MPTTISVYHDISCGHRVYGHESKCAHLHGHNYRIHFAVSGELDHLGRILDFSEVKKRLCHWLETHWDHRTLLLQDDPWVQPLQVLDPEGIVAVAFNPTAELMAEHLLHVEGPRLLAGTGAHLIAVRVEETRKCSAEAKIS